VEPGSGKVRALAVNRNFKLDDRANPQNKLSSDPAKKRKGIRGTYPNTTNPLLTGGDGFTGYQAGSAFKLFAIVAALEKGYPLATSIATKKVYVTKFPISGPNANCGGYYCASGGGGGVHNMWTAFGSSVNTYFVPLAIMAGIQNAVDVAKKMGITFHDEPGTNQDDLGYSNNASQWGAFTLGVSATTPLELANAYATVVADGLYCEPMPVDSITDIKGNKLAVADRRCKQVIAPDVARAAVDAGRCPGGDESAFHECNGHATNRDSRGIVGKPITGKTGTTDDDNSVTLTLSTKQLAVSGFLTDPDYAYAGGMRHATVNPAVQRTLRDYMKGKPAIQFTKPSAKIARGDQVSIPSVECKTVAEAKAILQSRGFQVEIAPEQIDSRCPKGTAAGTTPTGRTIRKGVVAIEVSNGGTAAQPGGPGGPGGPGNGPKPPPPNG
jgi:membrane peptidoglycan carboxypeptidase